jgi:dephospho-CoA kinase
MTLKLALTGSIGMGKSTVAAMFVEAGIALFDADAEVRALQGPQGALVAAIESRFPGTTDGGAVDRERLAARVLGNRDALAALEVLVHPAVLAARERFLADHRGAPALLFDIPLLFETGGEASFNKVIVVSAPTEMQRERVLARPGMNREKYEAIMARQMPDAEKRARADFVIDTGDSLVETRAQVTRILACLGLSTGR